MLYQVRTYDVLPKTRYLFKNYIDAGIYLDKLAKQERRRVEAFIFELNKQIHVAEIELNVAHEDEKESKEKELNKLNKLLKECLKKIKKLSNLNYEQNISVIRIDEEKCLNYTSIFGVLYENSH